MQFTINKHTGIRVSGTVLWLLMVFTAQSQNSSNYLQLTSLNTSFTLNSESALETQQVKSNAFRITIVSRSNDQFNIYARVQSSTGPNGTGLPASQFSVRLNSMSPSLTASYNTIPLSNSDQLIQSVQTFWLFWLFYSSVTFNYDLLLSPVGYNYPAGSYTTTLLFTMTQP